ncbi:MAG: ABC transporter ATP-binding protein, partial [Lachnospiraceae bacterium]|nr:ABC transporter ATP-binding protein [Lachnospiraceae bacterium]
MGKIFKYLWESWPSAIAIVVLLVIQAYCDLQLPQYTSNIVDVGIGQGGIAYAAPEKMREETYEDLLLFLTAEEKTLLEDFYVQDTDGCYVLTTQKEEDLRKIDSELSLPMLLLSTIQSGTAEMDMDMLRTMFAGGLIKEEDLLAAREQIAEGMGDMSDSIISARAVQFVQAEYEALGMDSAKVQTSYLTQIGLKMLGLSILMMTAAILVGLLASKTAARTGRNLRNRIFTKVVSFSNAEMDKFSTASLITRSTNDIQQVQMVVVMLLRMVLYAPIIGIGGVIKVMNTGTGMGWIIGVAVGSIMALVLVLLTVAMPKFKIMQSLVDRVNLISREILTGIPVIRAFSREEFEEKRFDKANKELMSTQLFTSRVMTFMMPAMMLIMNGISVMIVWFGGKGVDAGTIQVGEMLAFITYTMQIVMSFLMLAMISIMLP